MNYLATWIYLDKKGEETNFPQTAKLSSSKEHQDIYWRCVYIFFKFAKKRLQGNYEFLLFTNFREDKLFVDDIDIIYELKKMNVKIIIRDFTYKLPKGYYGSWGNQLYEFDIFEEFCKNFSKDSRLLMLDSDCLIMKDLSQLYSMLDNSPAITYWGDDYYKIIRGDEKIPIWYVLSGKKRYKYIIKKIDRILSKSDENIISLMQKIFFPVDSEFDEMMYKREHFLLYKKTILRIPIVSKIKKIKNL